jgi:hypothetical protein
MITMENLAYFAPVLGCLAMGAVMLYMMRGQHHAAPPQASPTNTDAEIAQLRAEIAAIKAEQAIPQPDAPMGPAARGDR